MLNLLNEARVYLFGKFLNEGSCENDRRDSFKVDGDPENDAFLTFSVTFNNSSILEFLDLLQSVFQQLQPVVAFNRTTHGKAVFSVLHLVDTELHRFLQQGGDPVQKSRVL